MPNLLPTALPVGLQLRTRVFVVLAGIAILLFILNLVRKKQIREQYSLLWIVASVVLILTAAFSPAVDRLAHLVGIYYPPAFLFLIAILMILVLQFHFSTVISNLREQNKALIQDVGILTAQVKELRAGERTAGTSGAGTSGAGSPPHRTG